MSKPVGGRGKIAKHPTIMRRIPEGIKEAVEHFSDLYRREAWNGQVDNLNINLISSNAQDDLVFLLEKVSAIITTSPEKIELLPVELKSKFNSVINKAFSVDKIVDDYESREPPDNTVDSEILSSSESTSNAASETSDKLIEELNTLINQLDIKNTKTEFVKNIDKVKTRLKKLSRQLKIKDEEISKLQEIAEHNRTCIADYKKQLTELQRLVERLSKDKEETEEKLHNLDSLQLQYERLQKELNEIKPQYDFLAADAIHKKKMYDILSELIDDITFPPGKLKSGVKIALIAGAGNHLETIDQAFELLKQAVLSGNRKEGNKLENEALELLQEKPRRATKKRRGV